MHKYLPSSPVVPDCSVTLSVTPRNVLVESPAMQQEILEYDSGDTEAVTISDNIYFDVTLEWDNISSVEAGYIMDLYLLETQGKGMARTFRWLHPFTGYTYVVKFASPPVLGFLSTRPTRRKVSQVNLRVVGNA